MKGRSSTPEGHPTIIAVNPLAPYVLTALVERPRRLVYLSSGMPGWVATKMGGPRAPDDYEKGYLTQTWLAVSDDPRATVTGEYWHHRRSQPPAKQASDPRFQDELAAKLAEVTGVTMF